MSLPDGIRITTTNFTETLPWSEYLVIGTVILSSLSIGVYYGCFVPGNTKNDQFLMAGRSMSILPVTLSLVCSFVSAVTLLGNPVEVYYYGQQWTFLCFIPMGITIWYLYLPVFHELKLTSAYQYFEWRFSRTVRTMCSIFAIVHLMTYMPITTLGPSLALGQVAGLDYRISAATIFVVCVAYSSMGGLKAVLWTDSLQAIVMIVSLVALGICGIIEVGGFSLAWERNVDTGRQFNNSLDPDPRRRHTVWTSLIGGYLLWMPFFAATQAQIQRYNSVATLRQARMCLLFNTVGMMGFYLLCALLGMLIFAQFYNCDPVHAKLVTSPDQLLPLFVIDVLRGYPTLPGLLIAGITSGSMSTVSSALNSLSALITEDFVKRYWPGKSDIVLGNMSKIISVATGLIAFLLVFVMKTVNETIQIAPFTTLITGSLLGPILGVFTLGMFSPWANNLGVLCGMIISIAISGFVGLGNILAGRKNLLPNMRLPLTIRGCPCANMTGFEAACEDLVDEDDQDRLDLPDTSGWKNLEYSGWVKIWSASYMWQPGIGIVSTLIFGILFSSLVSALFPQRYPKVKSNLLSRPFVRLWNKMFGVKCMQQFIDYGEHSDNNNNADTKF
ncbi:sodium-coupled monocarboxylate transporter 1 [Folsomia candida]|uniref:sodium-coupled monocarboxylate transporter 1 n=1 Tax=Folsomia candida TaxID=158441 RepID=UPI0016052B30|nr:sodium-coupled monocarboxylate transporter 1 [Folsomia candida]